MCMIGKGLRYVDATAIDRRIRAWKVFDLKHGRLHPIIVNRGYVYTPGAWNQAISARGRGLYKPPFVGTSGFWSFKTRQEAREYARGEHAKYASGKLVVREVQLSGWVVEHEIGYRSAYLLS